MAAEAVANESIRNTQIKQSAGNKRRFYNWAVYPSIRRSLAIGSGIGMGYNTG